MPPSITMIESIEFSYPLEDVGTDANGFNLIYDPGSTLEASQLALRVHTRSS